MIRLTPIPEILAQDCPNCHAQLEAVGFVIPGMRNLADLCCRNCGAEYYGDLPAGQALFTPFLLDKNSGKVFGDNDAAWFSEPLKNSYEQRSSETLGFGVLNFSELKEKVILLNCLDTLYGHSLLKLLNAQFYLDNKTEYSLIILAPPFLEWMIPDGVAEAWIVDLPLRRGTEWNDWLANEIAERLQPFTEVFLSVAFSHPHFEDFDIERFTRVKPFSLENFSRENLSNASDKPVVTFIWREDRLWEDQSASKATAATRLKDLFSSPETSITGQTLRITRFAEILRQQFPQLDFAVVGLGNTDVFPDWIIDLRLSKIDPDTERQWCERYAASHVVVGVHGSNMLLPSAHAGSVIEIIGPEREGNFLQDILFRNADAREMLFRYRFVPHSTGPEILSEMVCRLLRFKDFRRLMGPEFCRHSDNYGFESFLMKKRSSTE